MRLKARTIALFILSAAWVVFIFARSLKDAEGSTLESAWVLFLVRFVLPNASMHFVRKLAHFTEFFILGGLLSFAVSSARKDAGKPFLYWRTALYASLGGLAAAACDELLQLSSPGRSCQITDVLLDFSGALLASIICSFIVGRVVKNR